MKNFNCLILNYILAVYSYTQYLLVLYVCFYFLNYCSYIMVTNL